MAGRNPANVRSFLINRLQLKCRGLIHYNQKHHVRNQCSALESYCCLIQKYLNISHKSIFSYAPTVSPKRIMALPLIPSPSSPLGIFGLLLAHSMICSCFFFLALYHVLACSSIFCLIRGENHVRFSQLISYLFLRHLKNGSGAQGCFSIGISFQQLSSLLFESTSQTNLLHMVFANTLVTSHPFVIAFQCIGIKMYRM